MPGKNGICSNPGPRDRPGHQVAVSLRVREYQPIDASAARDRQQAGDPVTSRVTCRPMHAPLMVVNPPDRSDRPTGRKFDRSASPRQRYRVTERALGRLALRLPRFPLSEPVDGTKEKGQSPGKALARKPRRGKVRAGEGGDLLANPRTNPQPPRGRNSGYNVLPVALHGRGEGVRGRGGPLQ
jgi:hypothetical protein